MPVYGGSLSTNLLILIMLLKTTNKYAAYSLRVAHRLYVGGEKVELLTIDLVVCQVHIK